MRRAILLVAALSIAACKKSEPAPESPEPAGSGEPPAAAPADPRTSGLFAPLPEVTDTDAQKVALGQRLYHDTGLSGDGTIACASCHVIPDGGDDGRVASIGIHGQAGPINSPTVLNARHNFVQFWDGRASDLKNQAAGPVTNPKEMGAEWSAVVAYLNSDPTYVAAFAASYPAGISQDSVTDAIAAFESTLVTPSRFDAWLRGDDAALTAEEQAGFALFNEVGCQACHNGVNVGGASYQKMGLVQDYFALRGGEITEADLGRFNVTRNEADRHFFKVPTLRNIARTAPYFHDGTAETLEEAVAVMAKVQTNRELDTVQIGSIVAFLRALDGTIPDVALPVVPRPTDGSGEGSGDGSAAPPADGSAAAPADGSAAEDAAAADGSAVAPQ